ncbi:MAG TPA: hypothetical protein VF755_06965, partial [Catenuloplanes sp.]
QCHHYRDLDLLRSRRVSLGQAPLASGSLGDQPRECRPLLADADRLPSNPDDMDVLVEQISPARLHVDDIDALLRR